jgi:hypothetical protein
MIEKKQVKADKALQWTGFKRNALTAVVALTCR